MATIGFELCREDHERNARRWEREQRRRNLLNNFLGRSSSITSSFSNNNNNDNNNYNNNYNNYNNSNHENNHNNSSSSNNNRRHRSSISTNTANSNTADNNTNTNTNNNNHNIVNLSNLSIHEDECCSTASYFSDDTSYGTEVTTDSRRQRKRMCAIRMMVMYLCIAIITMLTVVLWRLGFIFDNVDDNDSTMNSIQSSSFKTGYDEQGRMLCNGLVLNCFRRANEIMYATVHNAMSSREDGFLAYNNLYPLEDALEVGFRGITIDSCDCTRIGVQLCHSYCVGGFRRPLETFVPIVKFVTDNPHEIIIIEIQVGDESLGPLFDILYELPSFLDLVYQHPGGEDEPWPTLKEMIEMNKRIIIFAHDDIGCEEQGQCPMGVHPTFDYAFETPFGSKGVEELMDFNTTCSVSRGWSNSDFVIMNHFATDNQGLPDRDITAEINSAANLQNRILACHKMFIKYGVQVINLLVVDFWEIGDVLAVVEKYNSALPPRTEAPTLSPTMMPTHQQQSPSSSSSSSSSYSPSVDVAVPVSDVPLPTLSPTSKPTNTDFPTVIPFNVPKEEGEDEASPIIVTVSPTISTTDSATNTESDDDTLLDSNLEETIVPTSLSSNASPEEEAVSDNVNGENTAIVDNNMDLPVVDATTSPTTSSTTSETTAMTIASTSSNATTIDDEETIGEELDDIVDDDENSEESFTSSISSSSTSTPTTENTILQTSSITEEETIEIQKDGGEEVEEENENDHHSIIISEKETGP